MKTYLFDLYRGGICYLIVDAVMKQIIDTVGYGKAEEFLELSLPFTDKYDHINVTKDNVTALKEFFLTCDIEMVADWCKYCFAYQITFNLITK